MSIFSELTVYRTEQNRTEHVESEVIRIKNFKKQTNTFFAGRS